MKIFYISTLFALLLSVVSCDNHKKELEEQTIIQQALADSLATLEEEDRLIKGEYQEAMAILNAIDDSLNMIASRNQQMKSLLDEKTLLGDGAGQDIIVKINALKAANSITMREAKGLQGKASSYQVENKQIQSMITKLEARLIEKQSQLDSMNVNITNMRSALTLLQGEVKNTDNELTNTYAELKVQTDFLEASNQQLEVAILDLKDKNQFIEDDAVAYVICGNRRELRQNNILKLLSNQALRPGYRDQIRQYGTQFSIFERDKVGCGEGDIITILPTRDSKSYMIEGSTIKIVDSKVFWANSKSLVLIKN